jgi:hypothetical protein
MTRRGRTHTGALKADHGVLFKRLVDDKTGKIAEVRLDKKHYTFHCSIDDDYFESKQGPEVEAWAKRLIAIPDAELEWIPIMNVKIDKDRWYRSNSRDGLSADITVKASRFWAARGATGIWREIEEWAKLDPKSPGHVKPDEAFAISRPWTYANGIERPDGRIEGKKARVFTLPHQISGGDVFMQYDPELWAGIKRLVEMIEREFDMINELLATVDGHAQLRAIGEGTASFALDSAAVAPPSRRIAKGGGTS